MAEEAESSITSTSSVDRSESDCALAANATISSPNNTSELTESELLELLDSELNDELSTGAAESEKISEPYENGIDESESIGASLDLPNVGPRSEAEHLANGAIESDSEEVNAKAGEVREPSLEGGENESVEADAYRDSTAASEPISSMSDAPESESCQEEPLELAETSRTEGDLIDQQSPGSSDDTPEADSALDRKDFAEAEGSGLPGEAEAVRMETVTETEAAVSDFSHSPFDGVTNQEDVDLNEVPEDDMDSLQNRGAPECELAGPVVNRSESVSAFILVTPPTNSTAQSQECDINEVVESPSTESMNNASEDEQQEEGSASNVAESRTGDGAVNEEDVIVEGEDCPEEDQFINPPEQEATWASGREVIKNDDVLVDGADCPEEDQFVNPQVQEEASANTSHDLKNREIAAEVEDFPEEDQFVNPQMLEVALETSSYVRQITSNSGHRGSSDDELHCAEADIAARRGQNEQATTLGVGKPIASSSATDLCYEPECDQSDQNGNPDLSRVAETEIYNETINDGLERIELSPPPRDEEFGDFVQSEPSSPHHPNNDQSTQSGPKTLLVLADASRLDTSKLNADDLVHLSRQSSNQSLDSYDVMARNLESEEDDDVTITSYRELLKRYTQLREQREKEHGNDLTSSSRLADLQNETDCLKTEVGQKQEEIDKLEEKLNQHDEAAKRTIAQIQLEMKTRVDQVTKMYDDVLAEKDSMVVKFALQELKNTEIIRKQEAVEAKFRDMAKEREILVAKLKGAGVDKGKLSAQLHAKHAEVINAQKEIHKMKDALSSQDVKVKWSHNKLKNEVENHKETKSALEKTIIKLKEAREETETIRKNCQQMIKTYQESEDIKSNSLDQMLKEKVAQMKQEQQERRDQNEVHQMVVNELDSLKRKHKETLEEIQTLKDKLICLDQERTTQEKCISSYRDSLQLTKRENENISSRLVELENIAEERDKAIAECEAMRVETEKIRQQDKEYSMEADNCRARETRLLELTEKLTNKNAHLQSENTSLNTKNSSALSELEHLKNTLNEMSKTCKHLKEELHDKEIRAKDEVDKLTKSLNDKTRQNDELKRSVDDKTDEIKVIKRRQAATIKDLTRQLQQAKRRCEAQEPSSGDRADSLGSRTSSSNSLDTLAQSNHEQGDGNYSGSDLPAPMEMPSMADTPVVRHVEPDKQMLIERIVKLQRINARKSEKIEFLEDHINQLLLEIKKKNRLIQHYVTREEAGVLASNTSDNVKSTSQAQISKKGGIMASLYSSHSSDHTMTLELSLQINSKLQAVLEDTLLKNITLKENIDTLGAEIARLSQENRQLQLQNVKSS